MALTPKQLEILEAILFLMRRGEVPTVREVGALVGLRSSATVSKHLKALESARWIAISGKSRGIRIADEELLRSLVDGTNAGASPAVSAAADRSGENPAAIPGTGGTPWVEGAASGSERESSGRRQGTRHESKGGLRRGGGHILQLHLPRLAAQGAVGGHGVGLPVVGAIAAGRPIEARSEAFLNADPYDNSYPSLALDPRVFAASGELVAMQIEGDSMIDAGILDGDYVIVRRQNQVENGEIAAVYIDGEGTLKRLYFDRVPGANEDEWRESDSLDTENPSAGVEECEGSARPGKEAEGSQRRPALARGGRTGTRAPRSEAPRAASSSRSSVRLQPANERFDPLVITDDNRKEVTVFGKYVGLVRGDLRIL